MRIAVKDGASCPHCGAPVTTEICPYCGTPTAIASKNADMKYPVMECEEVDVNWYDFRQALIIGLGFFGFGIFARFMFYTPDISFQSFFPFAFFGFIGLLFIIVCLRMLHGMFAVSLFGKEFHGTVWGYMDNKREKTIKMHPGDRTGGQIIKILIDTEQGKKFLLYELLNDEQPYGINTVIKMKRLKNKVLIIGEK